MSVVGLHPNSPLWESIEYSIEEKLGRDFDDKKRRQLFAAHVASSTQQAKLASALEWRGGCPDKFARDYARCEHFFFTEAAEILGSADFMRLFGFPVEEIDTHLQLDDLDGVIGD